jgi:hypothetical protein
MPKGLDITINIKNNTNYIQEANVLGSSINLLDTANATTEYRWDFSSFSFSGQSVIYLEYKKNTAIQYTIYTAQLTSQTLQAIVDALNLLGIGYFSLYTELGVTYIGTYNANYTFGDFTLGDTAFLMTEGLDFLMTEDGNFLMTE